MKKYTYLLPGEIQTHPEQIKEIQREELRIVLSRTIYSLVRSHQVSLWKVTGELRLSPFALAHSLDGDLRLSTDLELLRLSHRVKQFVTNHNIQLPEISEDLSMMDILIAPLDEVAV